MFRLLLLFDTQAQVLQPVLHLDRDLQLPCRLSLAVLVRQGCGLLHLDTIDAALQQPHQAVDERALQRLAVGRFPAGRGRVGGAFFQLGALPGAGQEQSQHLQQLEFLILRHGQTLDQQFLHENAGIRDCPLHGARTHPGLVMGELEQRAQQDLQRPARRRRRCGGHALPGQEPGSGGRLAPGQLSCEGAAQHQVAIRQPG